MIADDVLKWLPTDKRDELAAHLKEAVVLKIQNVAEYYLHGTDKKAWHLTNDFPNVAPPWGVVWAEFETPASGYGLRFVAGELDDDLRSEWAGEAPQDSAYTPEQILSAYRAAKWGVLVMVYSARAMELGLREHLGLFRMCVGTDGQVVEGTLLQNVSQQVEENPPPGIGRAENRAHVLNVMSLPIVVLLMALTFCHCKNVVVAPQVYPPKLVKKRAERQRAPITKIYTLDIRPVHKLLSAAQASSGGSLRDALHICRGHFKDFSQGPGLFGKLKGLYWWNMTVRGTKAAGEVRKDYRVLPGDA